jgi:N-acetylneuraminic acid mutarotase
MALVMLAGHPAATAGAAASISWAQRSSMPTARTSLGVAASGGKVYAIGGVRNSGGSADCLSVLEAYDPATDTWQRKADMPTARNSLAVVTGPDGKIYAIGGVQTPVYSTVEAYDPATDTWQRKADMPTARFQLAAALGSNGRIYAIGGQANGRYLSTVEEYDPATDTWRRMADMPTARTNLGAAGASNGKIYAIGGGGYAYSFGAGGRVEEFDPASGPNGTWQRVGDMPTAREGLAVSVAPSGRIFAVGGGPPNSGVDGTAVEDFDPTTNLWERLTSLPNSRRDLGAAFIPSGRLYAVGGQSIETGWEVNWNQEATVSTPTEPTATPTPGQPVPTPLPGIQRSFAPYVPRASQFSA